MRLVDDYSSWCRARITSDLRIDIASEGPGEVRYGPATGRPGWVRCEVTVPGAHVSAIGPDPARAYANAIHELRAPEIVSVLRG